VVAVTQKEMIIRALENLAESEITEVFDFVTFLQWRRASGEDQSWFWTDEWRSRYQEAKDDLAAGRFKDFDDVEQLVQELKVDS
jgi:hypothetical protein